MSKRIVARERRDASRPAVRRARADTEFARNEDYYALGVSHEDVAFNAELAGHWMGVLKLGAAVGAGPLNRRHPERPFGALVAPSVAGAALALLGARLARGAGHRITGRLATSLAIGLAIGTVLTANEEGGILGKKKT